VSAHKGRTVTELLDDSDGLAREALLDMSADRALGMVRGWRQLMQSAVELWAVLPADPTVSANGDPIAILAAMGGAIGRSLAAGHWPGRGPRDEAWEQIASNRRAGPPPASGTASGIRSCANRRPDRPDHRQDPDIARLVCRRTCHNGGPDRLRA
jgi:hypothetical protein